MPSWTRRHWLATSTAVVAGAGLVLRPSDEGGAHDAYFAKLQRAMQAGPAMPTLVVDSQRFRANLTKVASTVSPGLALRVVVKSLPSLELVKEALAAWKSSKVMVFNAPQLLSIAQAMPQADVLLGKPFPVSAAKWVLEKTAGTGFNATRQVQWLIDTPARAAQYKELAQAMNLPLRMNLEIDVGLHRGGLESDQALVDVLKVIQSHPGLQFSGMMGYDAHVAAIPDLPGLRRKAMDHAQAAYAARVAAARNYLGAAWPSAGLTFNTGGSLTYHLHDSAHAANEVSVGSATVKPLDFEKPSTAELQAASFIATPVLKAMGAFRLPVGVEAISNAAAWWDRNQSQAFAIHGGHWLAQAVSPPGVQASGLYGASSNQQVMVASKTVGLQPDDWVMFRPRQSEAVFLQFGAIAVFDGERISARWPVFEASA